MALVVTACDSGGPGPSAPPSLADLSPLELVGFVSADAPDGIAPLPQTTTCEQSPLVGVGRRVVVGGDVAFDDAGGFDLSLVRRHYTDASAPNDTVTVTGSVALTGTLGTLAPSDGGVWYVSASRSADDQATIVVTLTREGEPWFLVSGERVSGCYEFVFSTSADAATLDVEGDAVDQEQRWRAAQDDMSPGYFGSFGAYANDSSRVFLRPDGSYQYTRWYRSGPCPSCTETPQVYRASGDYILDGEFVLVNSDEPHRSYALLRDDRLVMVGHAWSGEFAGTLGGETVFRR